MSFELGDLPEELQRVSEVSWQRFVDACQQSVAVNDVAALLNRCEKREELLHVWACSEFVANNSIACPQLLEDLFDSGDLDRCYQPGDLEASLVDFLQQVEEETSLQKRLRDFRQREMVRIAWRDLSRMADLRQTMDCLSELADACIRQAFDFHLGKLKQRYGEPRDQQGEEVFMVALGLGKLGGGELNFSSDVDLIFSYTATGETVPTEASHKVIDNQSFFTKLGQKIISTLDTPLQNGFVFRTDMRLRPNGDSGPLILSFTAMEHYYQGHGRTWERYALIKARCVAGDAQSAEALLSMLKPFIYRKYLDFGAFDSIRKMKEVIDQELNRKGYSENIKLGRGGIREVEFLVQCHQLIRGGRVDQLQTQSFYLALDGLVGLNVLPHNTRKQLLVAYEFLRNTEHCLQMQNDQQTHHLPGSELGKQRLAVAMGFYDVSAYLYCLDQHRNFIHRQFHSVLNSPTQEQDGELQKLAIAAWTGGVADKIMAAILKKIGFEDFEHVRQLLHGLRHSRLYRIYAKIDRDRLDKLMPLVLLQAVKLNESNRAITEFISIVEAIGRRSSYLILLIENPMALKQLLQLCAASPLISNHIGQHPVILDELLHPIVDIKKQSRQSIVDELHQRLQIVEQDQEQRMNVVREFQKAQILRIASADVSGALQVADIHRAITDLAEVLLQSELQEANDQVAEKFEAHNCEVGIIAYGKLATGELGYNSDLDIVVCYDNDDLTDYNDDQAYFYSRVGKWLVNLLTAQTSAGSLYELDMRLRPSGRSGTLVTSLRAFSDYQMNQAWTWEHQALVRSRVVVGSKKFREKFEATRKQVLSWQRDEVELKRQIFDMRRKMIDTNCQSDENWYDIKIDIGGMVEIEFLIQFWLLNHFHANPALAVPRGTGETLVCLVQQNIISETVSKRLQQVYNLYLQRSLYLKLMGKPVLIPSDALQAERQMVAAIWRQVFE